MKINSIQSLRTNPYQKKLTKERLENKTNKTDRDKLEISTEAKKLLTGAEMTDREKRIEEIKTLIESGNYEINYKKTAEKLLNYWKAKDEK